MIYKQKVKAQVSTPQPINRIWIYDRSGSMYGTIDQVVWDMIARAKELTEGDFLSIGWFSSEGGQFAFPIKSMRVHPGFEKSVAEYLHRNDTTLGCTCFSEVLREAEKVAKEMQDVNPRGMSELLFFTDGHPVVMDVRQEQAEVLSILKRWKPAKSLFVGYGRYYNKQFMGQMADAAGGSVITPLNLDEYSHTTAQFIRSMASPFNHVKPEHKLEMAFVVNGNIVTPLERDDCWDVLLPGNYSVFYIVPYVHGDPDNLEGSYALAYLLNQRLRTDDAIKVLGDIGDMYLIKLLMNAYTNADHERAESAILDAMQESSLRFMDGKDTHFVPQDDATCILDVLELLTGDEGARLSTDDMTYKRIGKKTELAPGFPKFEDIDGADSVPLNKLTFNSSRANVSIQAMKQGTVKLQAPPDGYLAGLPNVIDVVRYNNYTVIKDGQVNIPVLPVRGLSGKTIIAMHQMGVSYGQDFDTYNILLKDMPVINRAIAKNYTKNIDEYVGMLEIELALEARQKVLSYFIDIYNPEKISLDGTFTVPQQEVLKANGISAKGVYSPPTVAQPASDLYMAVEYTVYKDGCKSLPKVADVVKKLENNKALTEREKVMERHIRDCQTREPAGVLKMVAWLEEEQKRVRHELRFVRQHLQRVNFAVIVGKAWFKELDTRENAKYAGWVFNVKEIPVEI